MAGLVREQTSEIVAQFNVPYRGTWNNVAVHTIPPDAVFNSLNVYIREGKLRSRPGLSLFSDYLFTSPIIGGAMAVTPTEKIILAISKDRIYQLSEVTDTWTQTNITTIASNDFAVVDTAFMETTGTYVALIASEGHSLKGWDYRTREITDLAPFNVPRAKSVCIASSRAVCLIPPHTIVWSNVLNPVVFDPSAYAKRAQTGDMGILVESLSALSFVLYKERSIHVAKAQAGIDEGTAFSFFEPLYVEGPAGIHALVNVAGMHFYMTRNGRIAMFDGTRYPQWIADGVWFYLQKNIDQALAHLIRGIYDYRLHTITFFYPRIGDANYLKGMVVINLPFEGMDIAETTPQMSVFLGECTLPISHGCEKRFDGFIDRSLLFTAQSGTVNDMQAYLYDEDHDCDGDTHFPCMFQTGLQPMPDARHTTVTIETFLERQAGYGSILIEPVLSDALETKEGYIPDMAGQWIDLETNPVREYKGFGSQVRFFGVKYSWSSDNTVRYAGSTILAPQSPKFSR